MDNLTATRNLCASIVNTFYPDAGVVELALTNKGIEPMDEYAQDPDIMRAAIRLVMGYVETSRSENGISVGISRDAIKKSIAGWCDEYGLDAEEELAQYERKIEDVSNMW